MFNFGAEIKPTILVHYHVYKNAGSSVDLAIRDVVGENNFMEVDKDLRFQEAPAFNSGLIERILREIPNVRGFASHTFIPTIHRAEAFVALPIVFLRHPLLRLASIYRYEAVSEDHKNTPFGKLAQTVSFPEWLEAYLESYDGKNYQTCVLSMNEDGTFSSFTNDHPGHIGDIKLATERLDEVNEVTGVGIVETLEVDPLGETVWRLG